MGLPGVWPWTAVVTNENPWRCLEGVYGNLSGMTGQIGFQESMAGTRHPQGHACNFHFSCA